MFPPSVEVATRMNTSRVDMTARLKSIVASKCSDDNKHAPSPRSTDVRGFLLMFFTYASFKSEPMTRRPALSSVNAKQSPSLPMPIMQQTKSGSYVCDARSDLHTALGLPGEVQLLDAVQPRHFNQVTFHINTVTKRSDAETLSGEAFYYENIPEHLKKLFPTLLSKHVADDGTMSITISKVEGVTFSQCLVNRCISEIQVNCLLRSIMLLHGSHNATCPAIRHAADVYENYASKVERRFEQNYKLYERICMSQGKTDAMVLITPIVSALKEYRDHNRADVREFIHGDPVFSNCMRSISGETVLLDMNGKLGNTLTTMRTQSSCSACANFYASM